MREEDEERFEWVHFDPEEERSVLTANLCSIYGCQKCPGFARVADIPNTVMHDPDAFPPDPDATVFCVHLCHRVPS